MFTVVILRNIFSTYDLKFVQKILILKIRIIL